MAKRKRKRVSGEQVIGELAAIGFARVTDFLCVENDTLLLRSTKELEPEASAAIASIERTSNGIRVKFYDKLKALELLGKYMGLFEGKLSREEKEENNLLEAILKATREEVDIHDIPELQQAAAVGHDLVEQAGHETV